MKRIASLGLIVLMSLQCFYSLGVITYFQLNRGYIAETLCVNREEPVPTCYGQCFLKKKLAIADENTAETSTPSQGKQINELPVFLITENIYSLLASELRKTNHSRYLLNSSSPHYPTPFHPPALHA